MKQNKEGKKKNKMKSICGERASGKTTQLILEAQKENGVIVCADVGCMIDKMYSLYITGIEVVSYYDFYNGEFDEGTRFFIDDLDGLVAYWARAHHSSKLECYTLTPTENYNKN